MGNIPFIAVAFMLFLAVCMFYGQVLYKKKRIEAGKTVTILCGILIILTALYINVFRNNIDKSAIEREKLYQRAQAVMLGNTLTNMYQGTGKCLVIHNPVTDKNMEDLNKVVNGFKDGFGGKVTEMRMVPIKTINMDDEMMYEEAMMENTAEDFNKVISANSDCDTVIIMVPLPSQKDELIKISIFSMIQDENDKEKWIRDPEVKYPLVGVYNGYVGSLEFLFEDELIGAMTLWRPNPTIDEEEVPESVQMAFDKRYLVLTPDNLPQRRQKYPQLFPKEKE